MVCGNTGKWRVVPEKQKNTSSDKKTKSQKQQQNKKNQIINTQTKNKTIKIGKQTQPSCVNNGEYVQ